MSPTKRRAEQQQGQRRLDIIYARGKKATSSALPASQMVAYRNRALAKAEELLDTIVSQIQKYSPAPGKRAVALAKTIRSIADKVIEINALLCTLAQVEKQAMPGDEK